MEPIHDVTHTQQENEDSVTEYDIECQTLGLREFHPETKEFLSNFENVGRIHIDDFIRVLSIKYEHLKDEVL